jgi:hypothetical protein
MPITTCFCKGIKRPSATSSDCGLRDSWRHPAHTGSHNPPSGYFYFHSYEYLELSYKRPWFSYTRQIKKADSGVLGWPLVSIIFYEPQSGFDVCYGPVADELTNPDSIEILTLTEPMPRSIAPETEKLEDLAELAFPVTKEEKSKASGRVKKAAAKKAVRKAAPRKMAATKPTFAG